MEWEAETGSMIDLQPKFLFFHSPASTNTLQALQTLCHIAYEVWNTGIRWQDALSRLTATRLQATLSSSVPMMSELISAFIMIYATTEYYVSIRRFVELIHYQELVEWVIRQTSYSWQVPISVQHHV
jgi:hypothetical protein